MISICLVELLILMSVVYLHQLKRMMTTGERHKYLDENISRGLLDSAAAGLVAYHHEHGFYPQIEGDCFIDSIKQYVNFQDPYVYIDYMDAHGKRRTRPRFEFIKVSGGEILHCTYLGAGVPDMTIIYRPIVPDSYMLYSVGSNYIDEGGSGDDIVYSR